MTRDRHDVGADAARVPVDEIDPRLPDEESDRREGMLRLAEQHGIRLVALTQVRAGDELRSVTS